MIKLRMEIGNVPKRQQPDHRADNSRRVRIPAKEEEKFANGNLKIYHCWLLFRRTIYNRFYVSGYDITRFNQDNSVLNSKFSFII